MVIRNQLDLLRSAYCILVEYETISRAFEEFLWFPQQQTSLPLHQQFKSQYQKADFLYLAPNADRQHLDWYIYPNTIALYNRLFNNVHVLLYEDLQHNPGQYRQQLERIFGEPIKEEHFPTKINPSLSAHQIKWMKRLNWWKKRFQGMPRLEQLMYNAKQHIKFKRQGNRPFTVPSQLTHRIKEYYRPYNQQLAADYPELSLQKYAQNYYLK